MIFYFSGTGNSLWVAKQLANDLKEELICISNNSISGTNNYSYSLCPQEKIGFIFPIHSWGPPKNVMHFIQKMQLTGYQNQFTYFVVTCGDDIGCTKQILEKQLKASGIHLHAGYSVQMPNTYIALPGFDVDTREQTEQKLNRAQQTLEQIRKNIIIQKSEFNLYPGGFPYLKSYVIRPLFNRFLVTDKFFRTTDACVGCGLCAQACPSQNITIEKKHPVWHGSCTTCMACYHSCPKNAIRFLGSKDKGQYLHPDILNKK